MSISSLGIGSGLDLAGLVSGLVASERDPVLQRLDFKQENYLTELSAFGTLRSALSTFQTALGTLNTSSDFQGRTVAVTDSKVFSANAQTTASAGSYSVEISRLASSHTLQSSGTFTNAATDTFDGATGTLNFRFGTYTYDGSGDPTAFTANPTKASASVTIDSTNNTLQGIRDAVNGADIGVQASIITTGLDTNGNPLQQLVFTSEETGSNNAIEITVSGDTVGTNTDNSGLSRLVYAAGAGNQNLSDPQKNQGPNNSGSAVDAFFTVNGIGITSATNFVSDAIEGVGLTLKKTNSGSPETLTIGQNQSAVRNNIETFIDAYNSVFGAIRAISGYDETTQTAGILLGDFAVRSVGSQLRNLLNTTVLPTQGAFSNLSNIGINTNSTTGLLELDETAFSEALTDNFDDVAALFAAVATPSDSLIDFDSITSDTKAGEYDVNITKLATQGSLTGSGAITSLVVDANNDTFVIKVDGVQSDEINITNATYSSNAELAAQIQSRINADSKIRNAGVEVSVSVNGSNELVITSERYGSASKVEITSVDTNTVADLGLSVATGTDGVDVEGTINGQAASGSGRFLISDTGDSKGLRLEVLGGSLGSRGTVSFSRGIADQMNILLEELLKEDGLIDTREEGIESSLEEIQDERRQLDVRIASLEARLTKQFVGLDTLLANLQATSSYLSQQLESLNNLSNSIVQRNGGG